MEVQLEEPTCTNSIAAPPLTIGAFNIQIFGIRKMRQKIVTEILMKIITRYDILVIQEIRDRHQTSLDKLLNNLNTVDPYNPYKYEVSERLGRKGCKEQYAFLYRCRKLRITDVYQYDDGVDDGTDVFAREPFAVRFECPTTEIKDFAIIAIHTSPKNAVREIRALHTVYEKTKHHWDLEDIIIAGDFNADGDYVRKGDWEKITLRSDRRFSWLINDDVDTTVGSTDCAYDRFVVAGKQLTKAVVPGSAKTFAFDAAYNLTRDEAEDISDHYPIELKIAGLADNKLQRYLKSEMSITINQKQAIPRISSIRYIYRASKNKRAGFQTTVLREGYRMSQVVAKRHRVSDVVTCMKHFSRSFPDVIKPETISIITAYMNSAALKQPPYVYGLVTHACKRSFDVTVTCQLKAPLLCDVTITKAIS
ncbi:deoxyribonuclease-1 [Patella vulgata]|uniref:deoxyribonuclease-1 n=1 Tax=Patella vulgata TaxID=6465 RepID=UPI0021802E3D|nr:deoxyribonuclease-1 [Patella vulgata]